MEQRGQENTVGKIVYSQEFERFLKIYAKRDKSFFIQVLHHIDKIIRDPRLGKPLRYTLRNRRRVHVGSFVIVYEFYAGELRFLDCDHHDKIYKKQV